MESAVILMECPDQKGIISKVSRFITEQDANIIQSDQHSTDPLGGLFFMRLEFCFDPRHISRKNLETGFSRLAKNLNAQWHIHYKSSRMRMGILVSKEGHCLADLLYRRKAEELNADITLVISNHPDHRKDVEHHQVPYHVVPVKTNKKFGSEKEILSLVNTKTDFLVLARYMQILSGEFLKEYGRDIINIHHSFLPSFKGANPYAQAHARGVKVIGATAHFVTEQLDDGPIIEQIVEKVTHRDRLDDLKRKSRNLEKLALANAVQAYLEHRIIRYQNKTVVFS